MTYSEFHKMDLIRKMMKCPSLRTVVEVDRSKQEWTFAQTINYLRSSVTNHELNRAGDGEERQVRFTQCGRGGGGKAVVGSVVNEGAAEGARRRRRMMTALRVMVISAAAVTLRPQQASISTLISGQLSQRMPRASLQPPGARWSIKLRLRRPKRIVLKIIRILPLHSYHLVVLLM